MLVDPRQAFGQPLAVHGGARVEDLVDRFQAGDGFAELAADLGVPRRRSRTSSALPSGSPPEFVVDRSLGRHLVPDALRAAGAVVHTMADVCGERADQALDDEEWIGDVGRRGWIGLMKDAKVRYRPAELRALIDHGVRAFCLTNANLRGIEQAERLLINLPRIIRAARRPGPYICGVYTDELRPLWPKS